MKRHLGLMSLVGALSCSSESGESTAVDGFVYFTPSADGATVRGVSSALASNFNHSIEGYINKNDKILQIAVKSFEVGTYEFDGANNSLTYFPVGRQPTTTTGSVTITKRNATTDGNFISGEFNATMTGGSIGWIRGTFTNVVEK